MSGGSISVFSLSTPKTRNLSPRLLVATVRLNDVCSTIEEAYVNSVGEFDNANVYNIGIDGAVSGAEG
jgi:hypothetical protein